jgi:hypothetical protein
MYWRKSWKACPQKREKITSADPFAEALAGNAGDPT